MKYALAALGLLAAAPALAQSIPSPAQMGITKSADPEGVFVRAGDGSWATIGTIDPATGVFTPVSGGGGGGGDVNVTAWAGQPVGLPTLLGSTPTQAGALFPSVNAYILNTVAVTVASLPLPAGAATAANQASELAQLMLLSTAANQTNGTQKSKVVDNSGATLFSAANPGIMTCSDGAGGIQTCATGGSGGGGSTPQGFTPKTINVSASGSTIIIPNTAGQFTYISYENFIASGTVNVTLEYGTGTNCGTGTFIFAGPYALTAQSGLGGGSGLGAIHGSIPVANDVCMVLSGAVQVGGSITYAQSSTPITAFGGGGGGGGSGSNASVGGDGATAPTSDTLIGSKALDGSMHAASDANPFPIRIVGTPTIAMPTVGAAGATGPGQLSAMGVNANGGVFATLIQADHSVAINLSSAATPVQLVPAVAGAKIYVTGWFVKTTATVNMTFVYGTGTNCGTGQVALTGPIPWVADGAAPGGGLSPIMIVPASNGLCAIESISTQISGSLAYAQAP